MHSTESFAVTSEEVRFAKDASNSKLLTPIGKTSKVFQAEKGKVRVSFYFASWCAFCHKAKDRLEKMKVKFARYPVQFVGVSTEESEEQAKVYANANNGSMDLYYLGPKVRRPESLGVYPVITIQDQNGELLATYTGYGVERLNSLEKTLYWALGEGED